MSAEPIKSPVHEPAAEFSQHERDTLLSLARLSIEQAVQYGRALSLDPVNLPRGCHEPRACFVTLTKAGELRGCIGTLTPEEPLWRMVVSNARGAAERDTRFAPVTADELADLRIEISILSKPRPLQFASPDDLLGQLRPMVDGVILLFGGHRATFLPKVWEDIPEKAAFLGRLCLKAGLPPEAWRRTGVEVEVYTVEAFAEGR